MIVNIPQSRIQSGNVGSTHYIHTSLKYMGLQEFLNSCISELLQTSRGTNFHSSTLCVDIKKSMGLSEKHVIPTPHNQQQRKNPSFETVLVHCLCRGCIIPKRINVRVEHVKHSNCRLDFLERVKKNEELKKEAKEKGQKVFCKRQVCSKCLSCSLVCPTWGR